MGMRKLCVANSGLHAAFVQEEFEKMSFMMRQCGEAMVQ